jgi:adenine-specific DNA-methyltransferase
MLTSPWNDTVGPQDKRYVVQTSAEVIKRCILMTTDPGDLVFDPTCGSGTAAYVAEQWGRRWITCDTSRVALALARQRLMTATFPYYKLAHPDQGVRAAFCYETAPHITLESIAQNASSEPETLYDQAEVDRSTVRVSGPFTVEAVQPQLLDPDAVDVAAPSDADDASTYLDRMVEQLRRGGLTVRGQHMPIKRISPIIGSVLHAECDYEQAGKTITAAVIFGPQYGPLTSSQLQEALGEARGTYDALIAAAFTFDDQAHTLLQKATLRPPVLGVAINADLLMGNLLKTSKSSQVFSVFGKPDVTLSPPSAEGYTVTVKGVDIYDPNTGDFDASSAEQIAAWFLDTDYDGATFLVRQAYFPSQTPNPWEKISKALKGSVDPDQFAALQRTSSLPFKAARHKQCAVKVIDHRGNEVMTVLRLQ